MTKTTARKHLDKLLYDAEWRNGEIKAGRIVEVAIGCQRFWVDYAEHSVVLASFGLVWPIYPSTKTNLVKPFPWEETPFPLDLLIEWAGPIDEAFAKVGLDVYIEYDNPGDIYDDPEDVNYGRAAVFYRPDWRPGPYSL
jgi:hypothetical protein